MSALEMTSRTFQTFTHEAMLREPQLSLFQKVLLSTDGSVTELLALYTGQRIRARKLEQHIGTDGAPPMLRCRPGTRLLHRRILLDNLQGAQVYAASIFVFDRLSSRARARLIDSDVPIGVLWREEKSEMYREVLDLRMERNPAIAAYFDAPDDPRLLSRTYLLYQQGSPLGVITEKFPWTRFRYVLPD